MCSTGHELNKYHDHDRNKYPPINIDYLLKWYVEENYNESEKLVDIHNRCGGGLKSSWCPVELIMGDKRYLFTGEIHGMDVVGGLLYVLYGRPTDFTKRCELKCRYGNLVYRLIRDSKSASIVECIDGLEYPIKKDIDNYVEYMLGTIEVFKHRYIYYWKSGCPTIDINIDSYIDNVDNVLKSAKAEQYNKVVGLTTEMDDIDSEIGSTELDINSLVVSNVDRLEIERLYHEYNRMVYRYNRELKTYRKANSSMSSLDSTVSDGGRNLLDLKKKIYRLRYVPDEYSMIKNRCSLLDNLRMHIQCKKGELSVLSNKMEYERNIVGGKLVPEDWLNMDIYKECIAMDSESIIDTYIEHIRAKYKIEVEYRCNKWESENRTTDYCNWLVSRCMIGDGFQLVVVDSQVVDSLVDSVTIIRPIMSNNFTT